MIHRSEDGHDPSGIGGSLSKNPCNRKVSASSMVLGDRNTSSTKTTELVVSKSYTILIAAHARSEDMILVTNNVREFERVPDLEVENWVE